MKEEIVLFSKQGKKPEEGQCLRPSSPVMKPLLFYMLMDASSILEKKLRVPNKLMKKCRDKLPAFVTLVLPNGNDWLVRLTVLDDKLWFTDGWGEFVVRYTICVGSLLVFKYEGDSIFGVSIFNLKSYEVDYIEKPKAEGQEKQFSASHGKEKETENSCCPPSLDGAVGNNVSKGVLDQKMLCRNCIDTLNSMSNIDSNDVFLTKDADNSRIRPQSTRDVGIQVNGSEIDGEQLNKHADIKKTKKRKERSEPSNLVKAMKIPRKLSLMERLASLGSTPERERTVQSAEKFNPSNPHCKIIMRPSFVSSKCLHIPTKFSSKYLSEISELVTLEDSNGKQWRVRSVIHRQSRKLSQGWGQFVRDNHVKEGDVCVFELMDKKKVVLKVTIFRVSSHSSNETKIKSEVQA